MTGGTFNYHVNSKVDKARRKSQAVDENGNLVVPRKSVDATRKSSESADERRRSLFSSKDKLSPSPGTSPSDRKTSIWDKLTGRKKSITPVAPATGTTTEKSEAELAGAPSTLVTQEAPAPVQNEPQMEFNNVDLSGNTHQKAQVA
jgi:hypothetical protein